MTREDIIRMLRKSHLDVYGLGKDHEKFVSVVERFANLVAAAEREACAEMCEVKFDFCGDELLVADAIRARREQ